MNDSDYYFYALFQEVGVQEIVMHPHFSKFCSVCKCESSLKQRYRL